MMTWTNEKSVTGRELLMIALIGALCMLAAADQASSLPPTLPSDATLELVQLIHRHGARSAIVPANASLICPRGCGLLNAQGKDMLVKVGGFLKDRYDAVQYFDTVSYDERLVYSRSTDLSRTLQSADGILRGLFPNMSDYFPVVHTVQFEEDALLLTDNYPAYHVPATLHYAKILEGLVPFLLERFTVETAAAMGDESSLSGFCGDVKNYAGCILALQDIAATRNAEGTLSQYPLLEANYGNLSDSRYAINALMYPYNATNPMDVQRGSLGQIIVQRMLQNIAEVVQHGHTTLTQKMMHYSAHDTTMMPVCTTLGHNELMLPLFGYTIVLELLHANSTGSFYVRSVQALPGQRPETDHNVTSSVFALTCIDSSGAQYKTALATDVCLLDDFIRFINTTLPQSPAGMCYIDNATLREMHCEEAEKTPRSLCAWYRSSCPSQGCALAGGVLNAVDYSCRHINETTVLEQGNDNGNDVSPGVAGGIAAGAVVAGAILGLTIAMLRKQQKDRDGYETVQDKAA